ncbi:MAG: beta-ketoacyl-[acyl-carrier-protein] synthase family protein [Gammaproteobacteria bacterium]|nr:beta-ketoacyl-[acyl-carrier-protein] synthase family protein [Gammaproteobacteria bacterium]MCP5458514.1 beta-ketoacyl-[acyl-carrier-protein] synthase family protein [Gammaproteobacteria bacterium]
MPTLEAYTLTSALGRGLRATLSALQERRSGLRPCDFEDADLPTWIGRVEGVEDVRLPDALQAYACRNNQLAWLGLQQDDFIEAVQAARRRFGARRIGVFIGTTTSGIREAETAYRHRDPHSGVLPDTFRYRTTHNGFSCTDFVRQTLGLRGPAQAVLTACSSSAKAFAVAQRFMQMNLCDAAVVGGVDSLCLTTLYGFHALQLLSSQPCRPWDAWRDGLSIGEAAGFALLYRNPSQHTAIRLLGYGESLDAHHITSPHPQGAGAVLAMQRALQSAGLTPQDIDFISLHGTATPANDAIEDQAVHRLFGDRPPCASTKGWTGHTLGAAGIAAVVLACLGLEQGLLPGTLNTREVDPALRVALQLENRPDTPRRVLVNAFGFGGNNCSLLLGKPAC